MGRLAEPTPKDAYLTERGSQAVVLLNSSTVSRVEQGFEAAVGKIPADDPVRARVLEAFQRRIEDHFHVPGFAHGGNALDHMVQSIGTVAEPGTSAITPEQYERLQRAAVAVAASVIEAAGQSDFVRGAWETLGRKSASDWTEAMKQECHKWRLRPSFEFIAVMTTIDACYV